MPIHFTIEPGASYFVARLEGELTDGEFFAAYRDFYRSDRWHPGLHELADTSGSNFGKLTTDGMRKLAEFTEQYFEQAGVESSRTAIYAPRDLPFGIARMYQALSDQSPEAVQVFRDLDEAREWLEAPTEDG